MQENDYIRKAVRGDETAILGLIKELAEYEREPDAVINTAEKLAVDLFNDKICDCFVYVHDNNIIGIALYYISYSTWKGRCLYLEDLYVQPQYRRLGAGKLLFEELLKEAHRLGVKRMDWQVLEWNEPAINFYKRIGATLDPEWLNGRIFFE
ncbi:MAG: GNAT family N-acetyltransferase [Crocinitomicaceae bacterium]|jgi:GNAT superfamily N-acetyltransferase|nr:GNAT family N-acetyltransferase [Crocinitomicaceae bacterium]